MCPMNGLMVGLIVSTVKNSLVHIMRHPNHVKTVNAVDDDGRGGAAVDDQRVVPLDRRRVPRQNATV